MSSIPAFPPLKTASPLRSASEGRILEYLEREFLSLSHVDGVRLPPVRSLATQLGVVPSAVYNTYRRLQNEGVVVSTVGRGTFLKPRGSRSRHAAGRVCIALSVVGEIPLAQGMWGATIVNHLLSAAAQSSQRVSILPLSCQSTDHQAKADLLIAEADDVDALIIFPTSSKEDSLLSRRLDVVYSSRNKPILHLNAPGFQSTENFVSADYFGSSQLVARSWLETGRRKIAFMAPAFPTVSTLQRMMGLNAAIMDFPDAAPLRCVYSSDVTELAGAQAAQSLLESGAPIPDAIFAFGDLLARGALGVLEENGISVPEKVSLVAGTGIACLAGELSATTQPLERIASELISMALASLSLGGRRMPGIFIPAPFVAGRTSRAEETIVCNALQTSSSDTAAQP